MEVPQGLPDLTRVPPPYLFLLQRPNVVFSRHIDSNHLRHLQIFGGLIRLLCEGRAKQVVRIIETAKYRSTESYGDAQQWNFLAGSIRYDEQRHLTTVPTRFNLYWSHM